MLALKSILAGVDHIPSLIFDEIDAGIGGEVALKVADRLREVATHHQVFVITHLPQLASRADHQFLVEKGEVQGLASTTVRELKGEERVREIARMLGGTPIHRPPGSMPENSSASADESVPPQKVLKMVIPA